MEFHETDIWIKIQQKDIQAFERYYKVNFKSFFLMACKYVNNSALAEEIVNDVFLKIWEDGNKILITTSLKSYIYKSVINRCINSNKQNKRELKMSDDFISLSDESYEMQQIEENELRIKLYAAIDQLPTQCKRVFEMSRFEEMKQKDIADQLGISIKTVKNHITIALKHLSKAVLNYVFYLLLILKLL